MKTQDRFDNYAGGIFGLAIGDALGYPVEFLRLSEIKKKFGERGVYEYPTNQLGQYDAKYSDDTQMSLAVADSLLKSPSPELEDIMKQMTREFIKWKNSPENNRGPGSTCMEGVRNLERGLDWKRSGLFRPGCGSVMRSAPIGLAFYNDLGKLKQVAEASSVITHNNPRAIAATIANSYVIAKAMQGIYPCVDDIHTFTKGVSPDFTQKLLVTKALLNSPTDPETAIREIGEGWMGDEAFCLGLYCALKNRMDFEKTVIMGANTNGDSDSIASIAGGIAGCYQGFERIPRRFLRNLENRELLTDTSRKLFNKFWRK